VLQSHSVPFVLCVLPFKLLEVLRRALLDVARSLRGVCACMELTDGCRQVLAFHDCKAGAHRWAWAWAWSGQARPGRKVRYIAE